MSLPKNSTIFLLKKELKKNHGIDCVIDQFNDKSVFTFFADGHTPWVTRGARIEYPFISENTKNISNNKKASYDLVAEHGFSTPKTIQINASTLNKAYDLMKAHQGELVVKPNSSYASKGLTRDVTNKDLLEEAVQHAAKFGDDVLIQEQFNGHEVRFTVIDGKVRSAILRKKPIVVGDGVSTVDELIAKENDKRKNQTFKYLSYVALDEWLINRDIQRSQVLKKGAIIEINKNTMVSKGATLREVISEINPANLKLAEDIAKKVGDEFIVIDIIFSDIKKSSNDNYVFLEYNTFPSSKFYYCCENGDSIDFIPIMAEKIALYMKKNNIIGMTEPISLLDSQGIEKNLIAKIDTGAYNGAIHATNISEGADDEGSFIKYDFDGDKNHSKKTYSYKKTTVTSATGHTVERYIISTKLKLKNKWYNVNIGLSDRTSMRYPVLIGRKFLRKHNLLVDVRMNSKHDREGAK